MEKKGNNYEQAKWSPEQYRQYVADKKANGQGKKFSNKKTVVDGRKFDSEKEAKYYGTLKLRKRIGEITDFEHHKVYKLEVNGILVCTYEADFVITNLDGTQHIIDVKSEATEKLPVFALKRKLMFAVHGIQVIVA
jgi:hypothetical protein